MRRVLLAIAAFLLLLPAIAAGQDPIPCTDPTRTICTAKKWQPFTIGADPASPTDTVPTLKWRLYQNGQRVSELPNAGQAPAFSFSQGLVDGEYQFYLEAIGTAFDSTGQPVEVASGPSNTVKLTVVTGNLSAPKNLRVK